MTTEVDLVAAAQAGDSEAFAELYRTHVTIVRNFFVPRVDNPEDVEDLVQDTFADAWEQVGEYQPTIAPFRAWLIGRARGVLIRFGWARWSHRVAVSEATEKLRQQMHGTAPVNAPHTDISPELDAAVQRLLPHKRRCVQLRYVEGLSTATVAELSGVQQATVRSHASKALADLRHELAPTFSEVA